MKTDRYGSPAEIARYHAGWIPAAANSCVGIFDCGHCLHHAPLANPFFCRMLDAETEAGASCDFFTGGEAFRV